MLPAFIGQALRGEDLTVFGDGEQTRDLVYVKDVVAALGYVGDRHDMHGTYNVGYGTSKSIKNLAALIIQLSGSTSQLLHQEDRIGDVKHSCASSCGRSS